MFMRDGAYRAETRRETQVLQSLSQYKLMTIIFSLLANPCVHRDGVEGKEEVLNESTVNFLKQREVDAWARASLQRGGGKLA